MAEFSEMRTLDVWYAHISEDDIRRSGTRLDQAAKAAKHKGNGKGKKSDGDAGTTPLSPKLAKKLEKRFEKNTAKARSRNSLQALSKLTEQVDGT